MSEKHLRTSKRSIYKSVFDSSPQGMILIDSTGRCLTSNAAASRILFGRAKRVSGLQIQDLVTLFHNSPRDISFEESLIDYCDRNYQFQLLNSGKLREIEMHCSPNISPGKHLIFLQDISGLMNSEAMIRKQAKLLNLADDTIMVRDLNDIIVYWNQGAERLYGWSRAEAVGRYVHSFLQTIFPEDFPKVREQFLRMGTWSGVLIHTVKSGGRVIVDSRWTLERDDAGKPVSYLEINNNITERKKAEDALHRAYEELDARVRERTLELSEANLMLQKEIQERKVAEGALRDSETELRALSSRLMYAQEEERTRISRELHDDLGQILTAIDLDLQRALKSRDKTNRNTLLKQVLRKSSEARGRIREISSLLRPGILDDIGIREAIEHYVSEFISRTGISASLSLECSSKDIPSEAATVLYRILQEALNNVSLHAGASVVAIRLSAKENRILLSIRDNGNGFDRSSLEKSLGITGMKERALRLEGDFQLDSSPGNGTEIRVELPRVGFVEK